MKMNSFAHNLGIIFYSSLGCSFKTSAKFSIGLVSIIISVFKVNVFCILLLSMMFDVGEGNGNPLQYSSLAPPTGEPGWAAVHGVAELDTTEAT